MESGQVNSSNGHGHPVASTDTLPAESGPQTSDPSAPKGSNPTRPKTDPYNDNDPLAEILSGKSAPSPLPLDEDQHSTQGLSEAGSDLDFDQDQDLEEEQLNLEKEQLNEEDHRDPQNSALKGKPQASFSSGVSSLQDPPPP